MAKSVLITKRKPMVDIYRGAPSYHGLVHIKSIIGDMQLRGLLPSLPGKGGVKWVSGRR